MTSRATSVAPANQQEGPGRPAVGSWFEKLLGLLFAIVCFEIGIFLLAFPWSRYWTDNYFGWISAEWHQMWMNTYLRGAVSGVGLVNLYLSVLEVLRLQRWLFQGK